MKVRKKGYWFLFILTVFFTLLTIATLLPTDGASKSSLIGYKAFCTFTPISTLLCAVPAGLVCFIRKRFYVSYK